MRTLIQNARIFNGRSVCPDAEILIDGDRIAEPDGGAVDVTIGATGKTLLPGLIDAHTHAVGDDLALALAFGVTTELDMFSLPNTHARLRALAAERDDIADLRSAGHLATPPGGHPLQIATPEAMAFYGESPDAFKPIESAAEAGAFVKARLEEHADYVKIVIDDGTHSGMNLPVLAPEIASALVREAHAAGLIAIAHVWTSDDARRALDAGVDGLAHVFTDLADEDPAMAELTARIAASGVFVVSTLVYIEGLTGGSARSELVADERVGPRLPQHLRDAHTGGDGPVRSEASARAAAAIASLHRAGVPILAGTDATPFGPAHGAALLRELVLLCEAGLSPSEALAAATSAPARHFGLDDRGRIEPGLRADLVLVEGDPTEDVRDARAIERVWRRGVEKRIA
ncbi:amidohydrolase family protein [Glycomyces sp. NRRL B-16210]|uniref:amidohydrolase family protein n=1 Tax=Glycomyces sp. NRRL B-16210 TaxID=1463821 RepID=UPI0004C196F0|nr:amidohydrolase family protein [Glycomyces sp. NRRL B-16210]